jgi:polyisoprenoid-binding protein YceI
MTAGLGHNPTISIREFSGRVEFTPGTLDAATLTMTIQATALRVEDEMRDDDRRTLERIMKDQVLATSRFPEVTYQSGDIAVMKMGESAYKAEIRGKLTLNGITRNQNVTAQVSVGPYNLRANGNFEIRQSDYEIQKVSVAGGALTLRDELKFAFFIVAKLQE